MKNIKIHQKIHNQVDFYIHAELKTKKQYVF